MRGQSLCSRKAQENRGKSHDPQSEGRVPNSAPRELETLSEVVSLLLPHLKSDNSPWNELR